MQPLPPWRGKPMSLLPSKAFSIMVFIILISLIIAFIAGYFIIKKTSRQPGEPANNNSDLHPIPPVDTPPRRPKY